MIQTDLSIVETKKNCPFLLIQMWPQMQAHALKNQNQNQISRSGAKS